MSKVLIQANYVGEGLRGLLKEGGSGRRAAIEKLFGSVGGKVEAFYYAFGDTDVFVIGDVPDNVTAAALSLAVNASGSVNAKVTVLLTAEEIDAAAEEVAQLSGAREVRAATLNDCGELAAGLTTHAGGEPSRVPPGVARERARGPPGVRELPAVRGCPLRRDQAASSPYRSMPGCLKMALRVPVGISPEWRGTTADGSCAVGSGFCGCPCSDACPASQPPELARHLTIDYAGAMTCTPMDRAER